MAYKTFHLFAGAGGGILADLLLGHTPIGACEIEKYPRDVLLQRQRDNILPEFPIWDDVRTLDGKPWRGAVDVLCGGFPCQDISSAGTGKGLDGERSGLWREYKRLIGEMRPKFVFAENSPLLRKRGLDVILRDLSELGYNARWGVFSARRYRKQDRKRMWILASSKMLHAQGRSDRPRKIQSGRDCPFFGEIKSGPRREAKSGLDRVAPQLAERVDKLKAIGNGQDPVVAATAFRLLSL